MARSEDEVPKELTAVRRRRSRYGARLGRRPRSPPELAKEVAADEASAAPQVGPATRTSAASTPIGKSCRRRRCPPRSTPTSCAASSSDGGYSRIDTLPDGFADILQAPLAAARRRRRRALQARSRCSAAAPWARSSSPRTAPSARRVAIKVLKPELLANPEFRQRFQHEAQAVAADRASQRRALFRPRRRRSDVPRHGVRAGRDAGDGAGAREGDVDPARRAHRDAAGVGARRRARGRHHPSRSQAGERHPHRRSRGRRDAEADRLRAGQDRRRRRAPSS